MCLLVTDRDCGGMENRGLGLGRVGWAGLGWAGSSERECVCECVSVCMYVKRWENGNIISPERVQPVFTLIERTDLPAHANSINQAKNKLEKNLCITFIVSCNLIIVSIAFDHNPTSYGS